VVINAFKGVYELQAAANVFEAALNSPNVNTHLMGSLLNTGAIEQAGGKFILYAHGYTPAVIRCINALHEEKTALFQALGYTNRSKPKSLETVANPNGPSELALLRTAYGPTGMKHRYIDEDAYACASLMISLGELVGVPTPLARAMVTLASTINGIDYFTQGRTLKNLGLDGMTPVELNAYLVKGHNR
jgi:opine dehydrogenase